MDESCFLVRVTGLLRSVKDFLYEGLANIRNRHAVFQRDSSVDGVKIFVFQHFKCALPNVFSNRSVYCPLMCGDGGGDCAEGFKDCVGENISKYNPFLNEMTGLFWVATHLSDFPDCEFVGFNHYRRYLEWSPEMLERGCLLATSSLFWRPIQKTICFHLNQANKEYLLARVQKILSERDRSAFKAYLGSRLMYPYNMFIADRDTFLRYFSFIRPFIEDFVRQIDENAMGLDSAPLTEKRIYGYVLEHLTSFWIYRERRAGNLRVKTLYVRKYDVPRAFA